jgi:hypothetical protein
VAVEDWWATVLRDMRLRGPSGTITKTEGRKSLGRSISTINEEDHNDLRAEGQARIRKGEIDGG